MKHLKGFDGLRAISIIFVLQSHLGVFNLIKGNKFLTDNFNLFSGSTGVMVFFSISGFLITSLLLNEKEKFGRIHFKFFFMRRILRLLPPLVVLFSCLIILMSFDLLPKNYIALALSFFYLYNFVPFKYYTSELAHTWSLCVEEQFYFLWPFVISRLKIKQGILFAFIIMFVCVFWKIGYSGPVNFIGKLRNLTNYSYLDRWFIPACLPIMIGSMTAMTLSYFRSQLSQLLSNNRLFAVLPIFLFSAQLYIPNLSIYLIDILLPTAVSMFLLWIFFNQNTFIVSILEFPLLVFIGKISYGLYVYQGLFLRNGPGGELVIQKFPLNICLVFITAILSYYLIERKFMQLRIRFTPTLNKNGI